MRILVVHRAWVGWIINVFFWIEGPRECGAFFLSEICIFGGGNDEK
jgi:hypothetical protein